MIITNNEEALRAICQPVQADQVGTIIEALERELDYSNRMGRSGIGLAGIQIGQNKQAAIVRLGKHKINLVNAEIKNGYDLTKFQEEGCLSYPGRVEDTMRYQEIHVVNNLVEPHSFIATGLLAVVVQHEIDHYNSSVFLDHLAPKITIATKKIKARPNDPCICGKPVKYKKCCGKELK